MFGFGDPVAFLIGCLFLIPAIVVAMPVHEMGHAFAAVWMGDPSPRNRGFLHPQIRAFIHPYGVVAVFLANVGWGKPVPVNEYRLDGAGRKVVWALGGPVANLIGAVVFGIALRALTAGGILPNPTSLLQPGLGYVASIVYAIYFLNLSFFAFNLLPIPGLDGWRVVEALLRGRYPKFFFDVSMRMQTIWIICVAIIVIGPIFLRFDILGAAVGIFYQPAATAIVGECTRYTSINTCPLSARF